MINRRSFLSLAVLVTAPVKLFGFLTNRQEVKQRKFEQEVKQRKFEQIEVVSYVHIRKKGVEPSTNSIGVVMRGTRDSLNWNYTTRCWVGKKFILKKLQRPLSMDIGTWEIGSDHIEEVLVA